MEEDAERISLTQNAVPRLLSGEHVPNPVLQLLDSRELPGNRMRLTLSDGDNSFGSFLAASQIVEKFGGLRTHALILLERYLKNDLTDNSGTRKTVIIVNEISLLQTSGDRYGDPKPYSPPEDGTGRAPPPNPPSHHPPPAAPAPPQHDYRSHRHPPQHETPVPPTCQPRVQPPPPRPPVPRSEKLKPPPSRAAVNGLGSGAPATTNGVSPAKPKSGSSIETAENSILAAGCYPISALTPFQNRWKIRARVTKKNPMKTFTNARGPGKLFSLDLLDESGEIRATSFTDTADKFFNVLQENGVYYISGGRVKAADKRFTSIANDYELTFTKETEVTPVQDTTVSGALPTSHYGFVPFGQLSQKRKDDVVDVIGILKSCQEVFTGTSRQGKEYTKRDIVLVDQSMCAVTVTLWGEDARNFEKPLSVDFPTVAIKGARVSDFNGISLSMSFGGSFSWMPDVKESHALLGWYDQEGKLKEFQSLSSGAGGGAGSAASGDRGSPKLIAVAEAQQVGSSDQKPDYFSINAAVVQAKADTAFYPSCKSEGCKKKLVDQGNGQFRCEKCQITTDQYNNSMMLNITVADMSGQRYLTLFTEHAEELLGKKADELVQLQRNNTEEFERVFENALYHRYTFRIRAKTEHFNDETRVKWSCVGLKPMNESAYEEFLNDIIPKMQNMH